MAGGQRVGGSRGKEEVRISVVTTAPETNLSKVAGDRFLDITDLSRENQHVTFASTASAGVLVVIIYDSDICATCEVHTVDRIPPCPEHITLERNASWITASCSETESRPVKLGFPPCGVGHIQLHYAGTS